VTESVKIFITYSHKDQDYLAPLLGYLAGLEIYHGVTLWNDGKIDPGNLWDQTIKDQMAQAHIALALVSETFLNSWYCQRVEIDAFLQRNVPLGVCRTYGVDTKKLG